MYRHCLFCAADLGRNEVIEHFPVGRRLAFDAAKGRLWVICRSCERWNLTPLEERWEAVEEGERIFRETSLRVSTEHVGLARHREGLDMVRIGAPERPEFAAWRYGDQFGRRRKRQLRNTALTVGAVGGLGLGSAFFVGGFAAVMGGLHLHNLVQVARLGLRPKVQLRLEDGRALDLRLQDIGAPRLRPGSGSSGTADGASREGDAGWHLALDHREGTDILTGQDAVRALRVLLPTINQFGAGKKVVRNAVDELEGAGGPEAYFASAEHRARKVGWGYGPIGRLPPPIRLALEMAAHEDAERVALEGELDWLETAWREAEEVAAIADDLTLPEVVRHHFRELKRRHGKGREERLRP